jgi:hypothetical protein
MIADLLDPTQGRLGNGLRVRLAPMNLRGGQWALRIPRRLSAKSATCSAITP